MLSKLPPGTVVWFAPSGRWKRLPCLPACLVRRIRLGIWNGSVVVTNNVRPMRVQCVVEDTETRKMSVREYKARAAWFLSRFGT